MLKMRSAQMSVRDVTGSFGECSRFLFHGCNFVFKFQEICTMCWKSSSVQTFRMNFKHIWYTHGNVPTTDFEAVVVGIFQRPLLWRTFYSLHGLFNNILLNNSGIELYMLILPTFIHARYYIRNFISVESWQTLVSAFFFFLLISAF